MVARVLARPAFLCVGLALQAVLLHAQTELFVASGPEGYGFIDRNGTIVIPLRYYLASEFADGLAAVWIQSQRCGYIDTIEQWIIRPQFNYCRPFIGDIAPVETETGWTYIDRTGHPISPYVFDDVGVFRENRGPAKLHDQWGYIDTSGQFAVPPQFRLAWSFYHGRATVYIPGETGCTEIDLDASVLIKRDGGDCRGSMDDEDVILLRGPSWKYRFIHRDGTVITPDIFDFAEPVFEGLAAVSRDGLFGFIDRTGQVAIPLQFKDAMSSGCGRRFSEGVSAVRAEGRCGYIDHTGTVVIPSRYDSARPFSRGLAYVSLNRRNAYIDHEGRPVWMSAEFPLRH